MIPKLHIIIFSIISYISILTVYNLFADVLISHCVHKFIKENPTTSVNYEYKYSPWLFVAKLPYIEISFPHYKVKAANVDISWFPDIYNEAHICLNNIFISKLDICNNNLYDGSNDSLKEYTQPKDIGYHTIHHLMSQLRDIQLYHMCDYIKNIVCNQILFWHQDVNVLSLFSTTCASYLPNNIIISSRQDHGVSESEKDPYYISISYNDFIDSDPCCITCNISIPNVLHLLPFELNTVCEQYNLFYDNQARIKAKVTILSQDLDEYKVDVQHFKLDNKCKDLELQYDTFSLNSQMVMCKDQIQLKTFTLNFGEWSIDVNMSKLSQESLTTEIQCHHKYSRWFNFSAILDLNWTYSNISNLPNADGTIILNIPQQSPTSSQLKFKVQEKRPYQNCFTIDLQGHILDMPIKCESALLYKNMNSFKLHDLLLTIDTDNNIIGSLDIEDSLPNGYIMIHAESLLRYIKVFCPIICGNVQSKILFNDVTTGTVDNIDACRRLNVDIFSEINILQFEQMEVNKVNIHNSLDVTTNFEVFLNNLDVKLTNLNYKSLYIKKWKLSVLSNTNFMEYDWNIIIDGSNFLPFSTQAHGTCMMDSYTCKIHINNLTGDICNNLFKNKDSSDITLSLLYPHIKVDLLSLVFDTGFVSTEIDISNDFTDISMDINKLNLNDSNSKHSNLLLPIIDIATLTYKHTQDISTPEIYCMCKIMTPDYIANNFTHIHLVSGVHGNEVFLKSNIFHEQEFQLNISMQGEHTDIWACIWQPYEYDNLQLSIFSIGNIGYLTRIFNTQLNAKLDTNICITKQDQLYRSYGNLTLCNIEGLNISYKDIDNLCLMIDIHDDQIDIHKFLLYMSENETVDASGYVQLVPNNIRYNIYTKLNGMKIPLEFSQYKKSCAYGAISGSIALTGDMYEALASGSIDVHDMTIISDLISCSSDIVDYSHIVYSNSLAVSNNRSKDFLRLDITIEPIYVLHILAPRFVSTWTGKLHIHGKYSEPILDGWLDLVDGTYKITGNNFTLYKGHIIFTDSHIDNPFCSIEGKLQLNQYTIKTYIEHVSHITSVKLQSFPFISEHDIMQLILFNEDTHSSLSYPSNITNQLPIAVPLWSLLSHISSQSWIKQILQHVKINNKGTNDLHQYMSSFGVKCTVSPTDIISFGIKHNYDYDKITSGFAELSFTKQLRCFIDAASNYLKMGCEGHIDF